MKPFNTSWALIFDALTLFPISSANAGGCISHTENKPEVECLSDYEKFVDAKKKNYYKKLMPKWLTILELL